MTAVNAATNSTPSDFQGEGSADVKFPLGAGDVGVKGKVSATSDALQRFLDETDRFRQDRFFLVLFALVFCFVIATLAWCGVKMMSLQKEYAKQWPSKKDRKRSGGSPNGGDNDDNGNDDDDDQTS